VLLIAQACIFPCKLFAPRHCFDGMYSLKKLMYKVQDYNMECHCNGYWLCTDEILWLKVVLEEVWTWALELPLLFYWWLNLLIFTLCNGYLRGTITYIILSYEERGCIVGMRESETKSSNQWMFHGQLVHNLWNPDVVGIGSWLIMMLKYWHVMLEMIEGNHCQNYQAY
jgi:hypothetical protein